MSRFLNGDQNEHRMQVCQDIIKHAGVSRHYQSEPDLFRTVIIDDEACIFENDLETKRPSN